MRTRDEIEQALRKNDLSYHRLETDKGGWAILVPELGAKVLGTEGFFGTGVEDWKVPPELDPGSYRRIETSAGELAFQNDLTIKRLDGLPISLGIVRSIRLETVQEGDSRPGIGIPATVAAGTLALLRPSRVDESTIMMVRRCSSLPGRSKYQE